MTFSRHVWVVYAGLIAGFVHSKGCKRFTSSRAIDFAVFVESSRCIYQRKVCMARSYALAHGRSQKSYTRSSAAQMRKRPFGVTQCHLLLCQSTRHIWLPNSDQYSNLTSIFNRFWDITPIVCIYPYLSSRWNWKKTAGSRWTCFSVRVPRTFAYPTINLNPRQSMKNTMHARPRQTDGQTDRQTGGPASRQFVS